MPQLEISKNFEKVIIKPDFERIKGIVFISTILLIIFANLIYAFILKEGSFSINFTMILLFFALFLLGTFIHEFIHFIGFLSLTEAKLPDIKVGFKYFSPYVYCKKIVRLTGFRIAIILPVILTGIIPILIGFYIESLMLINVGCLLTAGGMGDIIGFLYMVKIPGCAFVHDYEDELGSEVYLPKKPIFKY